MNSKDSGITRGKRRIRGGVVNDRKQAVCGVSEFGDLLVIALKAGSAGIETMASVFVQLTLQSRVVSNERGFHERSF